MTKFSVPDDVAGRYPRRVVGARRHEELWVPADDLAAFCDAFAGPIEVVRGWLGDRFLEVAPWSGPLGQLGAEDLVRVVDVVAREKVRGGPRTGATEG